MNAVFHCKTQKNKRLSTLFKKTVIFLLFLAVTMLLLYNLQIIPVLEPFAEAQTSTLVTSKVQQIIKKTVNGTAQNFVELKYDEYGNVVSLTTNTILLSILNADIIENVAKELSKNEKLTVEIPIGNLSGGAFLTGRGPDISIPLSVSPKITCKIENEFYESGINQTLHRIVANISVDTYIFIPIATKKIEVDTSFCIAETVIVGKVPDAYTKINRLSDDISESEIDDIYDFGAY